MSTLMRAGPAGGGKGKHSASHVSCSNSRFEWAFPHAGRVVRAYHEGSAAAWLAYIAL